MEIIIIIIIIIIIKKTVAGPYPVPVKFIPQVHILIVYDSV
jgi:hypothetical protein